jgi:dihydroneopterin aldolase
MEHESSVGQRFVIDLKLSIDLSVSSRSDRLADTVSYADVAAAAIAAFGRKSHKLLESAAGEVADAILSKFCTISKVEITIHKPHAPLAAIFSDVGIVLSRARI